MALRAGQLAATALSEAHSGEIVSVFCSAVNLLLDSDRLIALLVPNGPIHPWAIDGVWWSRNIRIEMPVQIDSGILSIDRFKLRTDDIPIIDLHLKKKSSGVAVESIRRLGDVVGVFEFENVFGSALSNCLEQCRNTGNVTSIASVLGVGTGLTPSGDDILVGLLAALDLTSEESHGYRNILTETSAGTLISSNEPETESSSSRLRKNLVSELPSSLRSHTTILSAQMVEAAINGSYPEPLVTLANVLVDSNGEEELICAANAVARLGHESGRAMLSGFFLGLETVVTSRGKQSSHI